THVIMQPHTHTTRHAQFHFLTVGFCVSWAPRPRSNKPPLFPVLLSLYLSLSHLSLSLSVFLSLSLSLSPLSLSLSLFLSLSLSLSPLSLSLSLSLSFSLSLSLCLSLSV